MQKMPMIWIFGFGSLIFTGGINGRGMRRWYEEEDLEVAVLNHYRREWNACWHGGRYLGCVADHDSWMNGTLFPISMPDLEPFLRSEGSLPSDDEPLYIVQDVKRDIKCNRVFGPDDRVLTCVTANPSFRFNIPRYYKGMIAKGLDVRGPEFAIVFNETTMGENECPE